MLAAAGIMCSVTLNGIDPVYVNIFLYNFVSLQKDRISSLLIFSNISFIWFILKRRFLRLVNALHSVRKCFTVENVWYVIHYVVTFYGIDHVYVNIFGVIFFLSKRTEFHLCWCFQIDILYNSYCKDVFWC